MPEVLRLSPDRLNLSKSILYANLDSIKTLQGNLNDNGPDCPKTFGCKLQIERTSSPRAMIMVSWYYIWPTIVLLQEREEMEGLSSPP